VPEFGPCGGGGQDSDDESDSQQMMQKSTKSAGCCSKNGGGAKSLTCSDVKCCQKEEAKATVKLTTGNIRELLICFKCKKNPPNFTSKQDKVCKECFQEILVHRFKSSLRQNLKIWKDDLNLICISGGSNSMALLNMLYFSLFGNQSNRKMFFSVHILYIDEGPAVYGHSEEENKKNLDFIRQTCEKYKFTYTIIPLESIFDIELNEALDMKFADEATA
jgi:tRNA(Ile)-lysidine synthase TilS/MesJ